MATGFIYIVTTLTRDYIQKDFRNVPTEWQKRLYFGPCKVPMRKKMRPGDYVFGISPAGHTPRRIVFATQIDERLTYAEAYRKISDLRGPSGPIHVKPVNRPQLSFPENRYAHISGAMHAERWQKDLAEISLDAFFVCTPGNGWFGRWLGKFGPALDDEILNFLADCSIHNSLGKLRDNNPDATLNNPIAFGKLFTGTSSGNKST